MRAGRVKSLWVITLAAVFSLGLFVGVAAAAGPADAVKAFFGAAANGDLKAYKALTTGQMAKRPPKPGSRNYKMMKMIGEAFKSVDNVQIKGDKATAVAHMDSKKLAAGIIATTKEDLEKKIKDPKKRAKQLKMIRAFAAIFAIRLSKFNVELEKKDGKWLVSRLKPIKPKKKAPPKK